MSSVIDEENNFIDNFSALSLSTYTKLELKENERSKLLPNLSVITIPKEENLLKMKNIFQFDKEFSLEQTIKQAFSQCSYLNLLEAFLNLIGCINEENEVLLKNKKNLSFHKLSQYSECNDYHKYLSDNLDFIFKSFKAKELHQFKGFLEELKIDLSLEINSFLYLTIRNYVWNNDKILLLLTGNGLTWLKHQNTCINKHFYDMEINKFNRIYFNSKLLTSKLYSLINHPRIDLGFISSMANKNISLCLNSIRLKFNIKDKASMLILHQDDHFKDDTNEKPEFARSLDKIIQKTHYNETNLIIVESEKDKVKENSKTDKNSVYVKYEFNAEYFKLSNEKKEEIDSYYSKLIDSIIDLIENNEGDVREQIIKLDQ